MTKPFITLKPRLFHTQKNLSRYFTAALVGIWLLIFWFLPTNTTLFFFTTGLLNLFGWVWVWKNLRE